MSKIKPFELERYFAKYEFSAPYLLSCSDCDPFTLSELLSTADSESLRLWENLGLGYTESKGHPVLREEIAALYEQVKANDLLVLVPEEGIFIAMNVLLEKSDHVIVTYPGYQSLYQVAVSNQCEVSYWMPKLTEAGWQFDLNDLKALMRSDTKCLVLNFPHNPTGAMLRPAELDEIIGLAEQRGAYIFMDQMYRLLEYDEGDRLPFIADRYERGIGLFGMSKSLALAGLRVGWLATRQNDLLQEFQSYRDYTTICSSAPSEILALMGLRARDYILARNMDIIQSNLKILDKFFNRYQHLFTWPRPLAGTIAFPKLLSEKSIDVLAEEAVSQQGVMILPASVYGIRENTFRIGFGRRNMPEALERFETYLNSVL
jgi:aspartate/methionine/tyrosine aminotransferase